MSQEKKSFILIEKDLSSQKVCLHQLPQKLLITVYFFTINAYHIIHWMEMPDFIPWLSFKKPQMLRLKMCLMIWGFSSERQISQEEVWLILVNLATETFKLKDITRWETWVYHLNNPSIPKKTVLLILKIFCFLIIRLLPVAT